MKKNRFIMPLCMSLLMALSHSPIILGKEASSVRFDEAVVAKQYAGKEVKVIDVSEVEVDGASTLSVTFSVPLKADQNFNQKLQLIDSETGKVDGAWVLSKGQQELTFNNLEPNRKLTLTINPGIRGVNSKSLPLEHVAKLTTKDLRPMLNFASRGSLLPVRLAEGLPVTVLNVKQATVEFFKIRDSQLDQFMASWGRGGSLNYWESEELLTMADLVYTGGFKLNTDKNRRETVMLPIGNVKQLKAPGVYFALLRASGEYSYNVPGTIFTISDIGVSAHRYKNADNLTVFTQSLATGKPLVSVDLTVLDNQGKVIEHKISTNTKGYAEITNSSKADIILASLDGQTTMLRLKTSALDLSEFAVTGPNEADFQFFVFGPRDLYRPGETVLFNGLLRDQDGQNIQELPVSVEVRSPDGKVARSFVWKAVNQGFYQYQLQVPSDAPTGRWSFLVKVGDKKVTDYTFNVEDFLPERLALTLEANDLPNTPREALRLSVNGRYLYGAPAGGNLLSGQVYVRPLKEAVAKLPGYFFGNEKETNLSQNLDFSAFPLDSDGEGTIALDSQWSEAKSPLQLIVQASLQETGGRPIVRRVIQSVWPAKQLVGIRPLFKDKEVDEFTNVEFEVLLADFKGNKLPAKNLKVRFIRERRDYYWSYSDNEGWDSNYHQKDLVMDERRLDITSGTTAKLTFPVEWGYYRLEIENPATRLITSYQLRSGYWWQENSKPEEGGAVRPDQVKIAIDKPAYKAGDKAKITLTPPAGGNGYLMIESSDGLLWWQAIDVPATGKTFEIPIDSKWLRHDLYISALVVRPGERKVGATPKRAVGVLHLPLDRAERKINLTLSAPTKMEPMNNLVVKVKAVDTAGNPLKNTNVLVAAVDVGVLNITNYKTPDPFTAFFGRKGFGADLFDVYGQLIETGQGRVASLAFGGDAAMAKGGKKPDTSVTIVALQSKPVMLDDKGEAKITLAIPDFNGELRLMAQAWTASEFGMAEAKTVVAAPVIVELATPRFLAGGDQSTLALDITNLTKKPQTLSVDAHADGLVSLVSSASFSVDLAKGERKTVQIPVKAIEGLGNGKVSVVVKGLVTASKQPQTLTRTWTIGVRPAYPAETVKFREVLTDTPWQIPSYAMDDLSAHGREGLLQLSSQPPLNLGEQLRSLRAYPYGCAEQTTSGLYASLYSSVDLLQKLNIGTKQTDKQRREAIDLGIARLLGMQRVNGSFGLWNSDSPEEYWVSVYVTDFLLRARERGFSIPDAALQKAVARILTYVLNKNEIEPHYSNNKDYSRFAVQAYAGYVLARTKQAPLGALRTLYDRRSHAPSGLALVQLGAALKLMGDNTRAEQAIKEGLAQARISSNGRYWWIGDYGSEIRDNALILAMLQEHKLASDAVIHARLLRLSDSIVNQSWLSTQERNVLFLAGYRIVISPEKKWQAEVEIAGNKYVLTHLKPSLTFSSKEMADIVSLKVTNQTPAVSLYETVVLSGYPEATPKQISSRTFNVSKDYLSVDGYRLNLQNVKSGDLVIVRLKLYSYNRVSDALLVDLLPAGLELENQNLAQSSASLNDAADSIKESLKSMQRARIMHQEFRDDRYVMQIDLSGDVEILYLARAVTPGEFIVPPALLESMYRPDIRATSEQDDNLVVSPHQ